MRKTIFLLTKDCMSLESLPLFGNNDFSTPNIDELARKGTVFKKHYTAAASTAMSLSAMLTGKYPYEFDNRSDYKHVDINEHISMFKIFQDLGYETHLIWDDFWTKTIWNNVREFGDESVIRLHSMDIAQPAGGHKKNDKPIIRNDEVLSETLDAIYNVIDGIDFSKKQFVWLHLPHVIKGRRSYMDDMEAFDLIVGFVREKVGDDNIYLSTDHGHMNMHKGIVGYGFHVYEPIIHIPLITPCINGIEEYTALTCNIDIPEIVLHGTIPKHDYIISESTYYGQPTRKTAIVTERYKYIYNKWDDSRELYDLLRDPNENYNILKEKYFDYDRKKLITIDELLYYPCREDAISEYEKLEKIRLKMWRTLGSKKEYLAKSRKKLGYIKAHLKECTGLF